MAGGHECGARARHYCREDSGAQRVVSRGFRLGRRHRRGCFDVWRRLRTTPLSRKLQAVTLPSTIERIQTGRPLTRILGLGVGLAMVFGGTVGVGILRLPGTLAAALGDSRLIVLFWILGGIYSLLGAVAVAELAAMMPEAGGFYVYARRAFGNGPGFVGGGGDWGN